MKVIGGALLAGALAAVVGAVLVRRRYVVITVEGSSMVPTLRDGDRVLVRRRRIDELSRGDVVVLEPPHDPTGRYLSAPTGPDGHLWNIKRAVALPGDPVPPEVGEAADRVPDGALVVFGDNSSSIDSRQRGFYSGDRLLGVALRRLGGTTL
ncbi:signal peptidase I [Nonomuraea longicatena]|uniref:Signal peptidase I n=1 Tax=Nonomuraea longicatena TaxID=83682 RepID=A0ABP3Z2U9_9ACTN